jgi:hypothetical protein
MAEGPEGQALRAHEVPGARPLSGKDVRTQVATPHGQGQVRDRIPYLSPGHS